MTTREGRRGHRPLATKATMHLVLRSTKAKGEWSFKRPRNEAKVKEITARFAQKYGVRILSLGNAGNHLHFHLKLSKRQTYRPFIRAVTGAIAMAVTGASRWRPIKRTAKDRFWNYRPFTRVVAGLLGFLTLKDYVEINRLQGLGYSRHRARLFTVENEFIRRKFWSTG